MNKTGLALSSLVMAIPAALLAFLSVKSVFEMNESMPTVVTIIVWMLIVISSLIALSPMIFLIFGPKAALAGMPMSAAPAAEELESPRPAAKKKKKSKADDEDNDEFGGDDLAEADDFGEADDQLFDASDDEAGADDFEDNFNFDDDDAIEEEEEEPAPKKKKKK